MPETCFTNPCENCPGNNLVDESRLGMARTLDAVFAQHTVGQVQAASFDTLYRWTDENNQFRKNFSDNQPPEFDVVVSAAKKIAEDNCPSRKI